MQPQNWNPRYVIWKDQTVAPPAWVPCCDTRFVSKNMLGGVSCMQNQELKVSLFKYAGLLQSEHVDQPNAARRH